MSGRRLLTRPSAPGPAAFELRRGGLAPCSLERLRSGRTRIRGGDVAPALGLRAGSKGVGDGTPERVPGVPPRPSPIGEPRGRAGGGRRPAAFPRRAGAIRRPAQGGAPARRGASGLDRDLGRDVMPDETPDHRGTQARGDGTGGPSNPPAPPSDEELDRCDREGAKPRRPAGPPLREREPGDASRDAPSRGPPPATEPVPNASTSARLA